MSDVYVAVSEAMQVKKHHGVAQKYAFTFSSFKVGRIYGFPLT